MTSPLNGGLPIYQYSEEDDDPVKLLTPEVRVELTELLVKVGFSSFGLPSTITWMDFDGDGVCDFTAAIG